MLMIAKHGNNSSTSISGSADLLQNAAPKPPVIAATTDKTLPGIYETSNYAFLYAREWHPAVKYGHPVRKEIPVRTIFNLLGPLANPVHDTGLVEARILGVARQEIGLNFAEALRLSGARKALVVCGDENLDEVSCAGPSHCWHIHEAGDVKDVEITKFMVTPADFGLPCHPLADVHGGKSPAENAKILMRILRNELSADDPVLHFVLINTAALLAVSGVCDADQSTLGAGDDGQVIKERGPGGLRWKEGLRRARWTITSGAALKQWEAYVEATNAHVSVQSTRPQSRPECVYGRTLDTLRHLIYKVVLPRWSGSPHHHHPVFPRELRINAHPLTHPPSIGLAAVSPCHIVAVITVSDHRERARTSTLPSLEPFLLAFSDPVCTFVPKGCAPARSRLHMRQREGWAVTKSSVVHNPRPSHSHRVLQQASVLYEHYYRATCDTLAAYNTYVCTLKCGARRAPEKRAAGAGRVEESFALAGCGSHAVAF
nr:anthranilate phosphoribosyltransferase [Quercus suber]